MTAFLLPSAIASLERQWGHLFAVEQDEGRDEEYVIANGDGCCVGAGEQVSCEPKWKVGKGESVIFGAGVSGKL